MFLIFFRVPDVFAAQPIRCIGTAECSAGVKCPIINLVGCGSFTTQYYNNTGVSSCTTCPSGFNRVSKSITVPGCSNAITYYDCEQPCTQCTDCESEGWKMYVTPSGVIRIAYQRKVTATCNYATCVCSKTFQYIRIAYQRKVTATCNYATCVCSKTFQYRCNDGYYGRSINGLTGCSRCPINSSNGVRIWGNSVAGKNYSISGCFVASGGDESGDYMYSQDCYYKR